MGSAKSKWLLPLIALAVVATLTAVVQSYEKENAMMNDTGNTTALNVSIPPIDALAPEVTETATFAMG